MRAAIAAIAGLLAACHAHDGSAGSPDASVDAYFPPDCHAHITRVAVSCVAGDAVIDGWYMATTTHTCDTHVHYEATCTGGCAVEVYESRGEPDAHNSILSSHPELLCAETPSRKAGDACTLTPAPCMTRAILAADGTVAGQSYLTCDASFHCADATAPPAWSPVKCDAATIAQYGVTGTHGLVADPTTSLAACLLAWDGSTQAITSAVSTVCLGDWECPSGALCDDAIPLLSATTAPVVAVCKPGPRGTLAPAMLAP